MSGDRLSAWHRAVRSGLRAILLRADGAPRALARSLVFAPDARPRLLFARTIFRKNGLPRDYLDHETRDFLQSPQLQAWIREFDTPRPDEIAPFAATAAREGPVILLIELGEETIAQPSSLATALHLSGKWQPEIRFLPSRPLSTAEQQRLVGIFGERALRPVKAGDLPDRLALLLAGALPRAFGLVLLLAHLIEAQAALAYGDEARRLPDGTLAGHWFKPPRHSPLLARQGNLVGRMVALDLGRIANRDRFCEELLAFQSDRRRLLAELAWDLPEDMVRTVPHICHVNIRPADPLLPPPGVPLPADLPAVSILIPTRDGWDLLSRCLASLDQTDWPRDRLQVVIIDNGSTDPTCLDGLRSLEASGKINLIRDDTPFNFARLNNAAARQAHGELLVLLNNDTEALRPDWLKRLASFALQDGIGAVGPKLLYPDGTVQHAGMVLGMNGSAVHEFVGLGPDDGGYQGLATTTREISTVTGACIAIRRAAFEAVGGFNESFAVAYNDVVLCCDLLAARYRNIYLAEALFLHHESKTRGSTMTPERRSREQDECRRATALHPALFAADPYYSANLSLDVFFKPAFPPRRPAGL